MLELRKMELSDMDGLMKLKNAEGWNQLEKDWAMIIDYAESVNFVALEDNMIVGSVTALNYANTVAWIGMMLVEKEYRGRGIGKDLMLAVLEKLDKCASIKLDATPAGRPLYRKLGFKEEYTLYRMINHLPCRISPGEERMVTQRMSLDDIPDVAAFDKEVFGADRTELITRLYEAWPELAWLIRENKQVIGFCLGRPGQNYTQLGPVHAESDLIAQSLICSAINQVPDQALVVDIPAEQCKLRHWLEIQGFKAQRPFERMFLRENPHPGRIDSVYLIAGPELG